MADLPPLPPQNPPKMRFCCDIDSASLPLSSLCRAAFIDTASCSCARANQAKRWSAKGRLHLAIDSLPLCPSPPLPLPPLSFPLTCSLSPTLSPSSASSFTSQCHGSPTLQVGSKERTRAISSWIWARLAQEAPRIPACARRSKHLMCFSSYLRPWLHAEKASSYLLGK